MDQFNNLSQYANHVIPWMTFLAGITGSVHCIGMCGGLVAASTHTIKDNMIYQISRLFGYIFVAGLITFFKQPFGHFVFDREFSLMVAISIGLTFVFIGVKQLSHGHLSLPVPNILQKIQSRIFKKSFHVKNPALKAGLIGFSSIFLPCGFLYAMLFAVIAVVDTTVGFLSIITFWMGTLPALTFAPVLIKKYFSGLSQRFPRLIAGSLISFGLLTIIWRVIHFYGNQTNCH